MTTKIDSIGQIDALAAMSAEEFCKSITSWSGRELMVIKESLAPYKDNLKIIEGRLLAMGKEQQATLETVQQLLYALKKPRDNTRFVTTQISQEVINTLDFDRCVTSSLQKRLVPNKRAGVFLEEKELRQAPTPYMYVEDHTLVFSPELQKIATDKMVETILTKGTFTDITSFDFSGCKLLSADAPVMIQKLLPGLKRSSFACLSERRFCTERLSVRGTTIAINRPFYDHHVGALPTAETDGELVRDFVEYLIGKNDFLDKQNVERLLLVAALASQLRCKRVLDDAKQRLENTFLSLLNVTEQVSYEWLSRVNVRCASVFPDSLPVLQTLAFHKLRKRSLKDGEIQYKQLAHGIEELFEYPDFPDLSGIADRLRMEQDLDSQIRLKSTPTHPYPQERVQFLEAVLKKYPKNFPVLCLLGKIMSQTWNNKAANESEANSYFDQVPYSFAVKMKQLGWQNNYWRADYGTGF